MAATRRYVKNLSRFTYWNYPEINPMLQQRAGSTPAVRLDPAKDAHGYLSDLYRQRHEAGNPQAIFAYLRADVWAFRAPWVVQHIETWRQGNDQKSLCRLMRAYAYEGQGRRRVETINTILHDQMMFKEVVRLNKLTSPQTPLRSSRRRGAGCFALVAQHQQSNEGDVEKVYKHYKPMADLLMGTFSGPIRTFMGEVQRHLNLSPEEALRPPAPQMDSWEEVFQWLDDMAGVLQHIQGVKVCTIKPRL